MDNPSKPVYCPPNKPNLERPNDVASPCLDDAFQALSHLANPEGLIAAAVPWLVGSLQAGRDNLSLVNAVWACKRHLLLMCNLCLLGASTQGSLLLPSNCLHHTTGRPWLTTPDIMGASTVTLTSASIQLALITQVTKIPKIG